MTNDLDFFKRATLEVRIEETMIRQGCDVQLTIQVGKVSRHMFAQRRSKPTVPKPLKDQDGLRVVTVGNFEAKVVWRHICFARRLFMRDNIALHVNDLTGSSHIAADDYATKDSIFLAAVQRLHAECPAGDDVIPAG
jgi:hypothetical protein